ncbi:MAG: nitroreductase [Maricaulis sp.]|jgi:nitroreductase|nr:nitroreductase [Maricaulis sp.]HAQ35524.1 nitroreductase [Alphaproteobacteria bacterium]
MTDDTTPPPNRFPEPGDRLDGATPSAETLTLLARRRSTAARAMQEPGPDAAQLETLLRIAQRVPDHGKMTPWRFIVFRGEGRNHAGAIVSKVFAGANPDAAEDTLAEEAARFSRAPLVIGVVSSVLENHKIPEWEQILSAGAVCQNLLIAANAMGFAGQWLTEWYAYSPHVRDALGLRSGERIAGFVHIGSPGEPPVERLRPNADVTYWDK